MRSLSPDEAALWVKVTATITPLSRDKSSIEAPEKIIEPVATQMAIRWPQAPPPKPPQPPVGTTLDGTWDKRLRSGSVAPDRTIDLHGMSLDRAWQAIDRGLEQAIGGGARLVLLITGHHRAGEPPIARGKIRAAVHHWLAASRHAGSIAAVRGAHPRHGGGGSLYLVLRRR